MHSQLWRIITYLQDIHNENKYIWMQIYMAFIVNNLGQTKPNNCVVNHGKDVDPKWSGLKRL